MSAQLSTDLDKDDAVPYFLWDQPMTVAELRQRLVHGTKAERDRLLGRVLREARDTDVWRFTTPLEVASRWSDLQLHLGQRREFWEFLLREWRNAGLLRDK